jgi:hypothetical protein
LTKTKENYFPSKIFNPPAGGFENLGRERDGINFSKFQPPSPFTSYTNFLLEVILSARRHGERGGVNQLQPFVRAQTGTRRAGFHQPRVHREQVVELPVVELKVELPRPPRLCPTLQSVLWTANESPYCRKNSHIHTSRALLPIGSSANRETKDLYSAQL